MRVALIVIGIIVGLFVLLIGGCVACVMFVVSTFSVEIDEAALQAEYADDIALVRTWLDTPDADIPAALDSRVVAVLLEEEQEFGPSDYQDVLDRHPGITPQGHVIMNGRGSAIVTINGEQRSVVMIALDGYQPDHYILIDDISLIIEEETP